MEVETGIGLVKKILPPKGDDSSYHWTISITLLGVIAVLAAHIAWACGLIPGLIGFARADEVDIVKSQLSQLQKLVSENIVTSRAEYLEGRAFDIRVKQCEAIAQKKSALVFTTQLQQVLYSYRVLTGRDLSLPGCEEMR